MAQFLAPPLPIKGAAVAQFSVATTRQRSAAAVAFTSATEVPVAARRGYRRTAVADIWREVQGLDGWKGMLGPELEGPAAVLRSELSRYGELVQACYKAFDLDRASPRYLNCRYGKARMFEEVGMPDAGYEVTAYVYASPDVMTLPIMEAHTSGRGRWIGYVAVSTDDMTRRLGRRDLLVSFRGTVTPNEWMSILKSSLVPARLDPCHPRPDVLVESGFLSLYTSADKTCRFGGPGSCREQLLREVPRLIDASTSEDVSITVAGHSMGSALWLLLAYDLAELGLTRGATVTVFSFGGPRVGNVAFKERCDELGVKVLRVTNVHDLITKVPGILLNEATTAVLRPWRASCYTHVGVELPLHLFSLVTPACMHEMETYVALLRSRAGPAKSGALCQTKN